MWSLFKKKVNGGFYEHTTGLHWSNGAQSLGFERKFPNPPFNLSGTGYVPDRQIRALSPVPYVWANAQAVDNGLGSLQTGQLITQPLTDTNWNPVD